MACKIRANISQLRMMNQELEIFNLNEVLHLWIENDKACLEKHPSHCFLIDKFSKTPFLAILD